MASKKPLPAKDADRLVKTLLVLSRSIQQVLEAGAVETAMSERLSPSKIQVLRLLGVQGEQTPSQVARFLDVSKPAVTQIVDAMVREKLVTRKTAEHSRREVALRLSAIGTRRFRAIADQQRRLVKKAVSHSPGARRWSETLWQITEALVAADGKSALACLQCGAHEDQSCALTNGHNRCLFLLKEDAPKRPARQNAGSRARARRKPR